MNISDFRSLWLGQLTSTLGTWLVVVGVPLYVFDLTGSTAATGAAFVAETLPALMFGPAAGVFVDRLDRRVVMVVTDGVRALAVLSMLLARDAGDIWIIYVALVVENGAAQMFRPARQALIPALVNSTDRLPAANSMFAMIDGLVRLVGSVLGGIIYAGFGFSTLVVADASSYLVSMVACSVIRYRAPRRRPAPVTLTNGLAELRAGLEHVLRQRFLRGLLAVTALFYLANGALTALLVPFARTELDADTDEYGYLLAALGVGYLVGAPLARHLIAGFSTRAAVLVSVPWLSICFALAFGLRDYSVTLLSFAFAGAPAVVLIVAVQTAYQRHTPDAMLGRVTAAFLTVEMIVSVVGASAASAVAEQTGLMPVIAASLTLLGGLTVVLTQLLPAHGPPVRRPPRPGAAVPGRPGRPDLSPVLGRVRRPETRRASRA